MRLNKILGSQQNVHKQIFRQNYPYIFFFLHIFLPSLTAMAAARLHTTLSCRHSSGPRTTATNAPFTCSPSPRVRAAIAGEQPRCGPLARPCARHARSPRRPTAARATHAPPFHLPRARAPPWLRHPARHVGHAPTQPPWPCPTSCGGGRQIWGTGDQACRHLRRPPPRRPSSASGKVGPRPHARACTCSDDALCLGLLPSDMDVLATA